MSPLSFLSPTLLLVTTFVQAVCALTRKLHSLFLFPQMLAYCTRGSRLYFFHLIMNLDNYSKSVQIELLHILCFIDSVKYFSVDIPQSPIDSLIIFLDFKFCFYQVCKLG